MFCCSEMGDFCHLIFKFKINFVFFADFFGGLFLRTFLAEYFCGLLLLFFGGLFFGLIFVDFSCGHLLRTFFLRTYFCGHILRIIFWIFCGFS
ncbi:unnamed protein product [Meloidogyne enterolobii]|uniref:Uncharacterized protein n=1 Tax=Meloidogyne enterolobii TaxID=390850 RepID=A0ACB1AQT7_MELEN